MPAARAAPRSLTLHAILLAAAVVMLLPFAWMVTTSLTPPPELLSPSLRLWPAHPPLTHYMDVIKAAPWLNYFWNTVVILPGLGLANLLSSSLVGFIFAKFAFPGRNLLFIIVLSTAMIPFESYMVPFYLQIKALGWVNTYAGIAAPLLIMSFGIFFMRQSIMTIPDELLDAARIDGASEFYIYRRGALPPSQPAPGALAVPAGPNAWGFFILPMIVTYERNPFPLELGLAMF